MNAWAADLLSNSLAQRVAWALVHFLWQGAAVALLLAATLQLVRGRSAQVRWVLCCGALGLMAVLPVVTACTVSVDAPYPAAEPVGRPPGAFATVMSPPGETAPEPAPAAAGEEPASPTAGPARIPDGAAEAALAAPWGVRLEQFVRPALPWSFAAWLVGMVVMSVWHLGGWLLLERTKRHGVRFADGAIRDVFDRLLRRLRVSRPVRLLQSARVAVPTVAGWLRPVVLLPASALSGLSLEQIEAILAHELAHIRRYDCLVRLIQAVVETLLFYHPAVWWVSGRIRQESEHCCDDAAVAVCGSRVTYARALACMEDFRAAPAAAAAASGGCLLDRIRRIVGLRRDRAGGDIRRWGAAAAAVFVLAGLTVAAAIFYGCGTDTGTLESHKAVELDKRSAWIRPIDKKDDLPPGLLIGGLFQPPVSWAAAERYQLIRNRPQWKNPSVFWELLGRLPGDHRANDRFEVVRYYRRGNRLVLTYRRGKPDPVTSNGASSVYLRAPLPNDLKPGKYTIEVTGAEPKQKLPRLDYSFKVPVESADIMHKARRALAAVMDRAAKDPALKALATGKIERSRDALSETLVVQVRTDDYWPDLTYQEKKGGKAAPGAHGRIRITILRGEHRLLSARRVSHPKLFYHQTTHLLSPRNADPEATAILFTMTKDGNAHQRLKAIATEELAKVGINIEELEVNSFKALNPAYRKRVGALYEIDHLSKAVEQLVAAARLTDLQQDFAKQTLRRFIYDHLDSFVRGQGKCSADARRRNLAVMDGRFKEKLSKEQYALYVKWRSDWAKVNNALAFLMARAEMERIAKRLQKAIAAKLPKNWTMRPMETGEVKPLHWPKGEGLHISAERKGFVPADWKRGLGGRVHVWIMAKAYSPKGPRDGEATAPPATEIERRHGRRVLIWGGGADWKGWREDIQAALKTMPPTAARHAETGEEKVPDITADWKDELKALRFFYPPPSLQEVKPGNPAVYAIPMLPPGKKYDYLRVYRDAARGKYGGAQANSRFTLIGKLPGGAYPFRYSYRVKEVKAKGREFHCDLEFTQVILPGAKPGRPTVPFFHAELAPLPPGKYSIVFRTPTTLRKVGDARPTAIKPPVDALAKTPFRASFTIAPIIVRRKTADPAKGVLALLVGGIKPKYARYEPIVAAVTLQNDSDKAVKVQWPDIRRRTLIVELKKDGTLVSPQVKWSGITGTEAFQLAPGRSHTTSVEITEVYPLGFKPGKYKLTLRYRAEGIDLRSKTTELEVTPPTEEDQKAFKAFFDVGGERKKEIELYLQVIKKHPWSRVVPRARLELIRLYALLKRGGEASQLQELLKGPLATQRMRNVGIWQTGHASEERGDLPRAMRYYRQATRDSYLGVWTHRRIGILKPRLKALAEQRIKAVQRRCTEGKFSMLIRFHSRKGKRPAWLFGQPAPPAKPRPFSDPYVQITEAQIRAVVKLLTASGFFESAVSFDMANPHYEGPLYSLHVHAPDRFYEEVFELNRSTWKLLETLQKAFAGNKAATEAMDKLLKMEKLLKMPEPQRKKLESAVGALARKAIALKPRHARIGRADQNPVGLDMSEVLRLSGEAKDAAVFTREPRFYELDVKRLTAQNKLWALCAILDHPNIDAKVHAARALVQLADPASVPILLGAAKSNNYPVRGSENATVHMIYRRTLKAALEKITKLPLTPKGLPKGAAPYFVDFRKVEAWLAKAAATRPTTRPAGPGAFGPVTERVVAYRKGFPSEAVPEPGPMYLDLDTGAYVKIKVLPANKMVRGAGVDVYYEPRADGPGMRLARSNLQVQPLSDKTGWDSSPKHVWRALMVASPYSLTYPGRSTLAFKTGDGGFGILQILGFTKDRRGIRIRYKMLPWPKVGEPTATQPAVRHGKVLVKIDARFLREGPDWSSAKMDKALSQIGTGPFRKGNSTVVLSAEQTDAVLKRIGNLKTMITLNIPRIMLTADRRVRVGGTVNTGTIVLPRADKPGTKATVEHPGSIALSAAGALADDRQSLTLDIEPHLTRLTGKTGDLTLEEARAQGKAAVPVGGSVLMRLAVTRYELTGVRRTKDPKTGKPLTEIVKVPLHRPLEGYLFVLVKPTVVEPAATQPTVPGGKLIWADEKSGKVLFSARDIVRFDPRRQVFLLRHDSVIDVEAWLSNRPSRGFIVRDEAGVIYRGRFIVDKPGRTYDGPTVLISDAPPEPPLFAVVGGHPHATAGGLEALRHPRLLAGLKAAGVLGTIDKDYRAMPLSRKTAGWTRQIPGLRIASNVYAGTFRIGRTGRVLLIFRKDGAFNLPGDTVEIRTTVRNLYAKFTSVRSETMPLGRFAKMIDEGAYIHQVRNWWGPVTGAEGGRAKPGWAEVSVELILREKVKDKPKETRTVKTISLFSVKLGILPDAAAAGPGRIFPVGDLAAVGNFLDHIAARLPAKWKLSGVQYHQLTYPKPDRGFDITFYNGNVPFVNGRRTTVDAHVRIAGAGADKDSRAKEVAKWRGKRVFVWGGDKHWPDKGKDIAAALAATDSGSTAKPTPAGAALRAAATFITNLNSRVPQGWQWTSVGYYALGSTHPTGWTEAGGDRGVRLRLDRPNRSWPTDTSAGSVRLRVTIMDPSYAGEPAKAPTDAPTHRAVEIGRFAGRRVFAYLRNVGHFWDGFVKEDLRAAVAATPRTTQPAAGSKPEIVEVSVLGTRITHLWVGGKKVKVDLTLRVVRTDSPKKIESNWFLRRLGQAEDEHIGTDLPAMSEVRQLIPSPDGKFLGVLSVGEGHPIVQVVDLPLLVKRKTYKVLHEIDPFPGGVTIDRWAQDSLLLRSDMLLTHRGEDGRFHPVLCMERTQTYSLSVTDGVIKALSADAKEPVAYFIGQLSSKDATERGSAIMALTFLKARAAIPALRKVLSAEKDESIREVAAEALKRIRASKATTRPATRPGAAVGTLGT